MRRQVLLSILCLFTISSFAQRSVTQSWYVDGYSEQIAREYIDGNAYLLPIEGIWQSSDGYNYAIEKDVDDKGCRITNQFRMIVLESSFDGWSIGQIKGFIQFGSVDNIYSMKYYTRMANCSNTSTQQVILVQESPILLSFNRVDGGKIALYKLYPQVSAEEIEDGISPEEDDKQWSGSGIAISDKHIVTNYHVVDGAKTLIITGLNGNTNRNYEVEVVAADKFNDLAILHVNDNTFKGFPPFKYGFSTETKDIGTEVFVFGYPLITTMGEDIKLTNGIISAKTGFQGDVALYQISAPIQPGNSGGPLFDDDGDLIGIVNAKHTGAENVGYAIKLLYLKNLIESADLRISLASTNSIRSLSLKEKVKAISPMVVMIKANVSKGENRTKSAHTANGVNTSPQQIAKAEELYRKAYEAAQKADYLVAYNYIKQCNELYPNNASMLLEGVIEIYAQKYDEAIVAFEYCIENNYNIEYAAEELGGLYEQKGEYEKAVSYYTKCINSNGRNLKALFRRGFCKGQMNNRAEAFKDYKQVIKYDGLVEDNYANRYYIATSYNNIAYGYMCLGFVDARVNDNIMKALEKLKLYSFMWNTNGEYAYRVGEYERCISSMNNAIAISKANKETDRANSYLYRGLAYLKQGDVLHAYLDLEKAAELSDSVAQVEIKKIDVSTLDFSEEQESKMIKRPTCKNNKSNNYTIVLDAIEQTDECTILYFSSEIKNLNSPQRYGIDANTYIRDTKTGIKYPLIATENCAILQLNGYGSTYKDGKTRFLLYFPKLPSATTMIDFIESNESEWKIYGINLK